MKKTGKWKTIQKKKCIYVYIKYGNYLKNKYKFNRFIGIPDKIL